MVLQVKKKAKGRRRTRVSQTHREVPANDVSQSHIDEEADVNVENYYPMFWSSAQAAILTLVVQFCAPIFLSLQMGIPSELRLWKRILPYFALRTDFETFQRIVMWSALITATCLAIFSFASFVTKRRLQVQAGRMFGWLDIALLGGIQLINIYLLDSLNEARQWMWALSIIGIVGFTVGMYIVWVEYADRRDKEEAFPPDDSYLAANG